ncbi:MAG: DEAD/DEAH box helicase [Proteobacteria bacterium]|nr:DEAD/DEAH box helicase [Pseudomonadota bacterium]MBU1714436.1 DEAD/DEAH box helicase [Pseudomonadota bacterium]
MAKDQANIKEYISSLKASPRFGPQVVHHEELQGCAADYGRLQTPVPPELGKVLVEQGLGRLYRHQQEAIDLVRQGQNVIVATPTASGKSLIYNLPVFEKLINSGPGRALYLFPLKALAQDQLRAIETLAAGLPELMRPSAAICDGDTSSYRRKKIRENLPDILITNPDMLHLSMLGYHDSWSGLWAGLTHVIIDEVHTYRGVFGSHMAWVMRRLRRICLRYGADPQFVLSSATIGNPAELARDLLGVSAVVVDKAGAPRGERHFVFLNPHDSAGYAASQLLEAALKRGLRTIVYTQSRKMTELIYVWTRDRLGEMKSKLTSYRAGFMPEERREIEEKMSSGELLGIISTSALELGIDIGALDICILVGYPGTVMATWQRSGRVGRRQKDSLIVLIGQEDALDQHFMRNPKDFFERTVESAVLNPDNHEIMKRHLLCAAAEAPLRDDEPMINSVDARAVMAQLAETGELLQGNDGKVWFSGRKYPHRQVDLRGSGQSFVIRVAGADNRQLGQVDGIRCFKECHPGAVYLHRGETWLVNDLDLEDRLVFVARKDVNYFTRPLANKETEILQTFERVRCSSLDPRYDFNVAFGRLKVTDTVTGFQRRLVSGHQLINSESLDLPPSVFETEGLWIEIPASLQQDLEKRQVHFMGGIHAMEHALIGIFPLLVLCDRNDVGGIAYPFHPELKGAAVFIYDGHPGGVGLTRLAFRKVEELLAAGLQSITSCACETGCPSCVHSPKCGSGNRPIDKEAARQVLAGLLKGGQTRKFETVTEGVGIEGKEMAPVPAPLALPEITRRYGVFDLETKRSAEEVGGWHRAELMGISVAVLYDSMLDQYLVFREGEMAELVAHLQKLDLIVGFNNKRFDNKVLSAYTDFNLAGLPTLDLLEEVKNRLGYRLSLDRLAEHTLGVKKSADGLMALKWYKEGRIDKIIDYCRQDVKVTRDLYLFGVENRFLIFKNKAGSLVRCPVDFGTEEQK